MEQRASLQGCRSARRVNPGLLVAQSRKQLSQPKSSPRRLSPLLDLLHHLRTPLAGATHARDGGNCFRSGTFRKRRVHRLVSVCQRSHQDRRSLDCHAGCSRGRTACANECMLCGSTRFAGRCKARSVARSQCRLDAKLPRCSRHIEGANRSGRAAAIRAIPMPRP